MSLVLHIDSEDNLIVALKDLHKGEEVICGNQKYLLKTDVRAKHKFTIEDIPLGGIVRLYGLPVGKAIKPIRKGEVISTENIRHYAVESSLKEETPYIWIPPDIERYRHRTFRGVVRKDGRVGTANIWLILPLVFCENRNALALQDALSNALGYNTPQLQNYVHSLLDDQTLLSPVSRRFANIDGIRALTVNSGCGGTASDSESLCRILSAYADHPNVAGVTVFSLGCEKAQPSLFKKTLQERNPNFDKPLLLFSHQNWDSEEKMLQEAVRQTLQHLQEVNKVERSDVPLSKLKIGVKCGASDGFSGITANPVMGIVSDRIIALGGASCLAEFPELCGAEGDIVRRCEKIEDKKRFLDLMTRYEKLAERDSTSMADNPSPGNIKDGLITDAIKSLGAAKKSGRAPISAVCGYSEHMAEQGLSLICTPGNDLEAVTGQVAAGANVIIFSTGLGTPTGNTIVPVIKISTNTATAIKHSDMIDLDCGSVIEGQSLEVVADQLMEKVIATASGEYIVKADRLQQYDFQFWKKEVSL